MARRCNFNLNLFLSIVAGLLLAATGVVTLAFYHHDDVHSNAYGYITNTSGCYMNCGPVTQYCTGEGTISVTYCYGTDSTDTDNCTQWHTGTVDSPLFCAADCCDAYMDGQVVVYFEVEEDGTIQHIGVVRDYNLDVFLTIGIIALIAAATCGGIAAFVGYQHYHVV